MIKKLCSREVFPHHSIFKSDSFKYADNEGWGLDLRLEESEAGKKMCTTYIAVTRIRHKDNDLVGYN
jgi:hypothetical protein